MKFLYDPELLGLQVVRMMGEEALVFCPFHRDSRPSAEYNLTKGMFYCFGCQTSKTAKQLAEELGGSLVPMREIPETYHVAKGRETEWLSLLKNPLAGENEYLEKRQVPLSSVLFHGILENDDGIIFPLKDIFGDIQGVQVRHYTRRPKYLFYGNRPPVWPMANLFWDKNLFVTEGVFGVCRADKYLARAVAIMGAGSVSNAAKVLQNGGSFSPYAVMDSDYAGLLAAGKFVLLGIPTILPPWKTAPDEWSKIEWETIRNAPKEFATWDVMDVIEESSKPGRLEKALRKFYKRIENEI